MTLCMKLGLHKDSHTQNRSDHLHEFSNLQPCLGGIRKMILFPEKAVHFQNKQCTAGLSNIPFLLH